MQAKIKSFSSQVLIVLFISFTTMLSSEDKSDVKDKNFFNQNITKQELYEHIKFLASDDLKGRYPGTKEGRIAAEYIANDLIKSDLTPIAENGFQYFEVVTQVKVGENCSLKIEEDDTSYEVNKDFIPLSFTENININSEVVFSGYGFDIDIENGLKWDDYKDIDVKDKWVMIFKGDPEPDSLESVFADYSEDRNKVMIARDKGAAGVLFVYGPSYEKKDILPKLYYDQTTSRSGLPVFHITRKLADTILKSSKEDIISLEKELNDKRTPKSFIIPEIKLNGFPEIIQTKVTTQNVVALIPGTDEILKDEFIIIGGHYDHLGMGGPGTNSRQPDTIAVHNGADDNASGVAAVLEIVEKLSYDNIDNKRSILVMAFGAEEMGTLGSKFFTKSPLIDLKQVKMMFNLDMVGRLDTLTKELVIGGTGTTIEGEDILTKYSKRKDFKAMFSPGGYGPSDHASFYVENIPVLFFFTGAHEDYHKPSDDTETINFDGEKLIADYVYELILDIANRDEALTFKKSGKSKKKSKRNRLKVKLGILPDFAGTEKNGLRIDGVTEEGPADLGGLIKKDLIISIDGKEIKNIYDYMFRLAKFKHGQRISVEVVRDGVKKILIVEL